MLTNKKWDNSNNFDYHLNHIFKLILEIINKNHLINSQRLSSSQNKPEQNIKVGKKKAKNEIYYCLFLRI